MCDRKRSQALDAATFSSAEGTLKASPRAIHSGTFPQHSALYHTHKHSRYTCSLANGQAGRR